MRARSGIGFDAHPLAPGRPLILGGVTIPHDRGPLGHSDGDVLAHAVVDAALGGAGLGDIGTHFPSSDARFRGIDSLSLLARARELAARAGWRATYVDATIIAEQPTLSPFVSRMAERLSEALGIGPDCVNVKATTTDALGFAGRGEGVAALAIATMESLE